MALKFLLPIVLEFSRETEHDVYVYVCVYIQIYYKELAHMIMETNGLMSPNLQCKPAGWRPRRANGADEIWKQSAREFPLAGEAGLFVPFRPSTD